MDRRKIIQELKERTSDINRRSFVCLWAIVDGAPKVVREAQIYGRKTIHLIDGTNESEASELDKYDLIELERMAEAQREENLQEYELQGNPPENILFFYNFHAVVREFDLTNIGMVYYKSKYPLRRCRCTRDADKVFEAFVKAFREEVLK